MGPCIPSETKKCSYKFIEENGALEMYNSLKEVDFISIKFISIS